MKKNTWAAAQRVDLIYNESISHVGDLLQKAFGIWKEKG